MRAARTDANHATIREGLRQAGRLVHDLARVGQGFPDLLALTLTGRLVLLEVKMPGATLTPDEARFFALWHPRCPSLVVVTTIEEALAATQ